MSSFTAVLRSTYNNVETANICTDGLICLCRSYRGIHGPCQLWGHLGPGLSNYFLKEMGRHFYKKWSYVTVKSGVETSGESFRPECLFGSTTLINLSFSTQPRLHMTVQSRSCSRRLAFKSLWPLVFTDELVQQATAVKSSGHQADREQ